MQQICFLNNNSSKQRQNSVCIYSICIIFRGDSYDFYIYIRVFACVSVSSMPLYLNGDISDIYDFAFIL